MAPHIHEVKLVYKLNRLKWLSLSSVTLQLRVKLRPRRTRDEQDLDEATARIDRRGRRRGRAGEVANPSTTIFGSPTNFWAIATVWRGSAWLSSNTYSGRPFTPPLPLTSSRARSVDHPGRGGGDERADFLRRIGVRDVVGGQARVLPSAQFGRLWSRPATS